MKKILLGFVVGTVVGLVAEDAPLPPDPVPESPTWEEHTWDRLQAHLADNPPERVQTAELMVGEIHDALVAYYIANPDKAAEIRRATAP